MYATTTKERMEAKKRADAKNIAQQRVVILWREFAQRHLSDEGMTGAEIDVLTEVAACLEETSQLVERRDEESMAHRKVSSQ